MNKDKLQLYANLKNQVAALEEQIEALKPEIVGMMIAEDVEKVQTEFGVFNLEKRRTWEFSENVQIAEDNVKDLKAKEKAEGLATYTESPTLKFLTK